MPYNGSGTYSLPAGNPVASGSVVSSTTHNNTMADIAAALSNAMTKDGQSTPAANLKMGGFKFTGLGDGSAAGDSVNLGQVQDGAYALLGSVSGADTITAAGSPAVAAYAAGQVFRFVSAGANTGAVTLNIDSLGAKAVTKNGTTALVAGDIPSGAACEVVYDGTRFQLIGVVADRAAKGANTDITSLKGLTGEVNFAGPVSVSSATTTDIGAAASNNVTITGTTTITGLGTIAAGVQRDVTFSGALTLTHNATSLILPGAANVTTAAGDTATFVSLGSGNWRCLSYQSAAGLPLGVGQTLQAVTRSTGVTYTNTTGRPIFGMMYVTASAGFNVAISINGGTAVNILKSTAGTNDGCGVYVVPAGASYTLNDGGNATTRTTYELR